MSRALPPEKLREAMARTATWRSDPRRAVACPVCGTDGLRIIDRSARPHAEWYALSCPSCGLDHTLHIPLSAPIACLD